MVQKFGKKLLDKFIKSKVVLENNTIKENKYLKNKVNSKVYKMMIMIKLIILMKKCKGSIKL